MCFAIWIACAGQLQLASRRQLKQIMSGYDNIWDLHTKLTAIKYKQKYRQIDELKRNKSKKPFIFRGRVLIFCQWESWDIKHALRTSCWLPTFSSVTLLWGCWWKIMSHVEKISVWDLLLVVWPLQSILFTPSTFCWQRHRCICPQTHPCVTSPLLWKKDAPGL